MLASGVAPKLVAVGLRRNCPRAPFRFVTAARHAPSSRKLSKSHAQGIAASKAFWSHGLLVDVSSSMDSALARKNETTRMDARRLAIFLRETAADLKLPLLEKCVMVTPAVASLFATHRDSQPHSSTYLKRALTELRDKRAWSDLDA